MPLRIMSRMTMTEGCPINSSTPTVPWSGLCWAQLLPHQGLVCNAASPESFTESRPFHEVSPEGSVLVAAFGSVLGDFKGTCGDSGAFDSRGRFL